VIRGRPFQSGLIWARPQGQKIKKKKNARLLGLDSASAAMQKKIVDVLDV